MITTCIMLASMSPKLHKQDEAMTAHSIVVHLKELFHELARSENFEVSKLHFVPEMEDGTSPVQR